MAAGVVDALEARIEEADESAALTRLATELAHALVLGQLTAADAARISRGVSRRRRDESEPSNSGYWEATRDLVAAAAAALEDLEEYGALEAEVERSPGWKAILMELHLGPRTPTDLVRLLEPGLQRDDGRVTRQLDRMQARGLVQAAAPMGDERTRPRQLTPRAHRLAAKLVRKLRPELVREVGARSSLTSMLGIAGAVISMIGLLRASKSPLPVGVKELAACAGPRNATTEDFALSVAQLCEARGLVDVRDDASVVWDRKNRPLWRGVLEACTPSAISGAFSRVPANFLLCTDDLNLEPWRRALSVAAVEVEDVCTTKAALGFVRDSDWSAVVVDDGTFAPLISEAAGGSMHNLFIAESRRKPASISIRQLA